MKPKIPDFFSDVEIMLAHDFFAEVDEMIHLEHLAAKRLERYNEKRQHNAIKARRVYARFVRVMSFDPWKATQHIGPDVFGDDTERFGEVIRLSNKKSRISWVLWCMYHYWMFDRLLPGSRNYGKRYSAHRKLWFKYYEQLQERLRQERWDRKRAAVRAKREKRKLNKKGRHKLTPEEVIARLKTSKVQHAVDTMESIADLPKI